ncbi:hypothetical protein ANN_22431 [Periplaneta americana]|uniref:Uncharacterized protein n=1 Tax=Periplaneta americana TaxID=6978 RepID=A0ABQ8S8S2_PERAM|nr:hypothetical protein ANN_22431 [Periplaneta americana]
MSPGSSTESYPALARIGLRENPGKNLNQVVSVSAVAEWSDLQTVTQAARVRFRLSGPPGEHAMVSTWTPQQKVQCVLWLAEERSVTRVQRCVRRTCISRSEDKDPLPGFVKDAVYQRGRANTLEELRQRITNTVALVTPQMPQNNWRDVEYRLDVCRATQGAHIELH